MSDNTDSQPISIETNTENSELFTESFLNDLPIEIDGILYNPSNGNVEFDFPVETNFENNLADELESRLECSEITESILERAFNIGE